MNDVSLKKKGENFIIYFHKNKLLPAGDLFVKNHPYLISKCSIPEHVMVGAFYVKKKYLYDLLLNKGNKAVSRPSKPRDTSYSSTGTGTIYDQGFEGNWLGYRDNRI